MLETINDILSFLLELAMLASFAYAGFHWGVSMAMQYLLGIGIPIILILFWSQWLAPKAKRQLPFSWLLIVTLALFEAGALSLYLVNVNAWAILFAIVALINVGIRFGKK